MTELTDLKIEQTIRLVRTILRKRQDIIWKTAVFFLTFLIVFEDERSNAGDIRSEDEDFSLEAKNLGSYKGYVQIV